ncbi:hypothetical protein FACS189413_17070 [Bacteroidia bacterium]|nr:hypothetical protein FACS189413_17070 [Bacteroidia bacterium]
MKTIIPLCLFCWFGTLAAQPVFRAPVHTHADYRLWESFEDYPDNGNLNWAPAGWTFRSEAGNVPDKEWGITWHITEGSAMLNMLPADGKWIAYLNGAMSALGQTQDEWMISPVFTPSGTDYLLFDANYSPIFMFLDYVKYSKTGQLTYNFEHPFNTMQALISVDNSARWDTIWDASIGNYNEENIEDFIDNAWYRISVSLAGYAGKSIRAAFRLVGDDAQSSAIDHIRVNGLASYNLPQGFFYGGLDMNGYSAPATLMGAAYIPTVWNPSATDASAYQWTLPEIEGANTYTSGEMSPSAVYIHDAYYCPSLSVEYAGTFSDPYIWADGSPATFDKPVFFAGGNYNDWLSRFITLPGGKSPETFGVGNYNLMNGIDTIALATNSYLFGTDFLHLKQAFGNYFDKPAQPYHLKKVRITTSKMQAPAGSELTLTIYRIDQNGYLQDVLTTSKWKMDKIVSQPDFYTFSFETDVVVGDAVLMALSGFAGQKDLSFCVYSETMQNSGVSNAYLLVKDDQQNDVWVSSSEFLEKGVVPALCFTLDLDYSFIASADAVYRFIEAESGIEKSFRLNHWAELDEKWSDRLPAWVSSEWTENENGELIYTLKLTEELPEGFETRYADAELSDGRGATTRFTIAQGANPWKIKTLNLLQRAFVRLVDNHFELQYSPEIFREAEIFDVSGQSFGKYSLSGSGKDLLPVPAYPHGVYLVRLNGKITQTLKIIK